MNAMELLRRFTLLFVLHFLYQSSSSAAKKLQRRTKQLNYQDCGTDPNRPIHVLSLNAHPLPIKAPGKLHLSMSFNVTKPLPPTIGMDVAISKYIFGIPLKVPCYKDFGTCQYSDVCGFLDMFSGSMCPYPLHRRGLSCTCPFSEGIYSLRHLMMRLPKLDGILGILAKGDFQSTIRLYNEVSQEELGCVNLQFKIRHRKRKKHHNWIT